MLVEWGGAASINNLQQQQQQPAEKLRAVYNAGSFACIKNHYCIILYVIRMQGVQGGTNQTW